MHGSHGSGCVSPVSERVLQLRGKLGMTRVCHSPAFSMWGGGSLLREWRGSCSPGPVSPQGLRAEVTVCSRPGGSWWGQWEPRGEDTSLARSVSAHVVAGTFCPGPSAATSAATVGRADRQACLVHGALDAVLEPSFSCQLTGWGGRGEPPGL